MNNPNLMAKIQKLLNLGQSPNPHEAASAMAMAQKLMADNQLNSIDLETATINHVEIKSPFSVSKPKGYEVILAQTVAEAFGCFVIWRGSRSCNKDIYGKFVFVGARDNLMTAEHFFVVLQRRLLKGRTEFVKGLASDMPARLKTIQGDGWCQGYARAIKSIVYAVAGSVSNAAIEKYIDFHIGSRSGKACVANKPGGREGFENGLAAGNSEKLYRPMTTGSAQLQIKG